ncbi:hypothetical protein VPMS16_1562 [Vibrio sp. 16]|nr:hypothetical protein VPMS16_1562 [Vibrio sp. 16]
MTLFSWDYPKQEKKNDNRVKSFQRIGDGVHSVINEFWAVLRA